ERPALTVAAAHLPLTGHEHGLGDPFDPVAVENTDDLDLILVAAFGVDDLAERVAVMVEVDQRAAELAVELVEGVAAQQPTSERAFRGDIADPRDHSPDGRLHNRGPLSSARLARTLSRF